MLDYSFNEFTMIYDLYFVSHYFLEEKKWLDIVFINVTIIWEK